MPAADRRDSTGLRPAFQNGRQNKGLSATCTMPRVQRKDRAATSPAGRPSIATAVAVRQAESVRELGEHRFDLAVPGTMEQFQLAFGSGLAGIDNLLQHIQEARFILTIAIERGTTA